MIKSSNKRNRDKHGKKGGNNEKKFEGRKYRRKEESHSRKHKGTLKKQKQKDIRREVKEGKMRNTGTINRKHDLFLRILTVSQERQ